MALRDRYSSSKKQKAVRSSALSVLLGIVLAVSIVAGPRVLGNTADKAASNAGVSLPGRVVDLETGKPVKGASVVVDRSLPGVAANNLPPWAGESKLTADGDGRFVLSFPPDQVAEAEAGLAISLRIVHPDYIARKTSAPIPLAQVLVGDKGGDRPFFDTIKLEKGTVYSGRVVTPKGGPVAGARYEFIRWGNSANASGEFFDDPIGETDGNGQFRLRMPRSQQLAIYVTPPEHAPFQRYWSVDEPGTNPDAGIPPDLGCLVLAQGLRLSGRLVNVEGRPIPGAVLTARSMFSRHQRSATTDKDGRFAFPSLRQGNYLVTGEGQNWNWTGFNLNDRPIQRLTAVFAPVHVYLTDGIVPDPLVIREPPTVKVTARFVDSKGRAARGYPVGLLGSLPLDRRKPVIQVPIFDRGTTEGSINGPEREAVLHQSGWSAQLVPDDDGRVVFRAPKGLQNVQVQSFSPDPTVSIRTRLAEGKPLTFWSAGQLDELRADVEGVTFVVSRSATILATITKEDGETPDFDVQIQASFTWEGGSYGANWVKQADGRYRVSNLMPGPEYEVTAWALGFVPNRVHRVTLAEGSSIDLRLVLKRQPKGLSVGDFAPPFLVKTLAGDVVGLGDLRGKFVLLHFWSPQVNNCVIELPGLQAVCDRFVKDDRLAMIGFCLTTESDELNKIVKTNGISWPQVMLRDRWADSIVAEYQAGQLPKTFLIGPDGKLVAKDVTNDKVAQAVANALGPK
jgi:peroxiredoxin